MRKSSFADFFQSPRSVRMSWKYVLCLSRKECISDKVKICFASTLLVGVGTLFITLRWLRSKRKAQPPTHWRKVGEIAEIFVFPVKSLGPVRLNETECTILGCKSGWLRDRSLLVVDETDRFLTARKLPKMVKVIHSWVDDQFNRFESI